MSLFFWLKYFVHESCCEFIFASLNAPEYRGAHTHTHTITPLRFRAENPYLASIKINERYLRPGILLRSFILFKSLNSDKEVSVTISKLHSIKVWSVWISWFIVTDPKLVNFYCLFFSKSYIYTESIKMPGRPLWQVRVACFSHNFP